MRPAPKPPQKPSKNAIKYFQKALDELEAVIFYYRLFEIILPPRPDALQQISTAVRGVPDDRAETIAFMRMLYGTGGSEFHSYPKVVDFVRTCRDEKSPYFDRCAQIQALVRKWAKKEKDGIQKVWRSLTQELKPSHGKNRRSKFFG